MMLSDILLQQIDVEAGRTRRLLARVPAGKAEWTPHSKSMSLGRLAGHVAELPFLGQVIMETEELDFAKPMNFQPFVAADGEAAVQRFEAGIASLRQAVQGTGDERMLQTWTLRRGEKVINAAPRFAFVMDFLNAHTAHHRGQLTVYLRLLDVPLPGLFGPSADEPTM
jgi:uncharacterized damage-inducible protein DinB